MIFFKTHLHLTTFQDSAGNMFLEATRVPLSQSTIILIAVFAAYCTQKSSCTVMGIEFLWDRK
jgi:hypothetical protein